MARAARLGRADADTGAAGNRRTMRGRRLRVSAADDKAWPLERWAALLHRIHARLPQAVIVLCGAPRESLLLE